MRTLLAYSSKTIDRNFKGDCFDSGLDGGVREGKCGNVKCAQWENY